MSAGDGARLLGALQTTKSRLPSGDLLKGAAQIAEFLFGDRNARRKVYYLAETNQLPVIRLAGICARKSTLMAFIEEQERRGREAAEVEAA